MRPEGPAFRASLQAAARAPRRAALKDLQKILHARGRATFSDLQLGTEPRWHVAHRRSLAADRCSHRRERLGGNERQAGCSPWPGSRSAGPCHKRGGGTSDPDMFGYTLPEIRRLLINLIQVYSPDPVHVWSWSRWRRRQYQARLCHYRRRGYALT